MVLVSIAAEIAYCQPIRIRLTTGHFIEYGKQQAAYGVA